ncbi:polyphosphate polymerase domain-containing protein [Weissella cibaria]|uniref:polyphosphate polymerase domain-containing protein n=1 Tax=Weissella cibaria TaxID=137591 RepID=UPI001190129A|nr:polyphosphate polymerase domain-containing protein [Weissella cibaria]TVV39093.1 polyphosphate polymerase domain-containing protein [Weissella cibaria]
MQVFNRYEVKYLITADQVDKIIQQLLNSGKMRLDKYIQAGDWYPIQSLYFASITDVVSQQALRLELNEFKQRLRLRTYGPARASEPAFLEIKKKFLKKTYKRRVTVDYQTATAFLMTQVLPTNQITREVAALRVQQQDPVIKIAYDRVALHATQATSDLRISFDRNVRYDMAELDIATETIGYQLLKPGMVLMEIKTELGMPSFLRQILGEYKLRPTRFSKFERGLKDGFQRHATAYQMLMEKDFTHA